MSNLPPSPELSHPDWRSGMEIPDSPARQLLERQLSDAYSAWYTSWGNSAYIAEANSFADSIAEVAGLEVLRESSYGRDYEYRCAHYAFGDLHHEPWAVPGVELPSDIWREAPAFLLFHGYHDVQVPEPGDIVAYFNSGDIDGRIQYQHFGVLDTDGKVRSKFSQGPIVRHPVDLVPSDYGNTAHFYRKVKI